MHLLRPRTVKHALLVFASIMPLIFVAFLVSLIGVDLGEGLLADLIPGILTGLLIALGTLIYVVMCVMQISNLGNKLAVIAIALLLIYGFIRYHAPLSPVASAIAYTIITSSSWLYAAWMIYLALTTRPLEGVGIKPNLGALPRLLWNALRRYAKPIALGLLVLALIPWLIAAISSLYVVMTSKPILAVDKIVLPEAPYNIYRASERIGEIIVNVEDLDSLIQIVGLNRTYTIPGKFEGDLEDPIGSVVETPSGKLLIDRVLASKIEKVPPREFEFRYNISKDTLIDSGHNTASPIAGVLGSLWQIVPTITVNFYLFEFLTGLILFLVGTIMVGGGRG